MAPNTAQGIGHAAVGACGRRRVACECARGRERDANLCIYSLFTRYLLAIDSHFAMYCSANDLIAACIVIPFVWQASRNRSCVSRLTVAVMVV